MVSKAIIADARKRAEEELAQRGDLKEAAEKSLRSFVEQAWHSVDPDAFIPNWHVDAICEHLEAVSAFKIKRLVINCPPRVAKSLLVSVFWPVWDWTKSPEKRFLCASYGDRLSVRDSQKRRYLIQGSWFQARWGDKFKLTGDQNEKMRFDNDKMGFMLATSPGGFGTGEGCDVQILDDPNSANARQSEAKRELANTWVGETLASRFNNPKTGARVIVQQRVHELDVSGYLLEKGGYTHLMLPMRFEKKRACVTVINGKEFWRDPRKEDGELLFPKQFGEADVAKLEEEIGPFAVPGQLQQRPAAAKGGLIKREWIKTYSAKEKPEEFEQQIQSWDMSFKGVKDSDFVVGGVWGRLGANFYLLERLRRRMSFPETVSAVREMSGRFPDANAILIEDKANGPAVIDTLKSELAGIIAITPRGSKEARLHAVSPFFNAGNVFIPGDALWFTEFVEELVSFPTAPHDDQVDMTSQALEYLHQQQAYHMFPEFRKLGPLLGEPEAARHVRELPTLQPWWYRWASAYYSKNNKPSYAHWYCLGGDERVYVYREFSLKGATPEQFFAEVARKSIGDLDCTPELVIYAPEDLFSATFGAKSIASLGMIGLTSVLGNDGAFLLERSEAERKLGDPQSADKSMQQRKAKLAGAHLSLAAAVGDRADIWAFLRDMLRFQPVTETGPKPDPRLVSELLALPEGPRRAREYVDSFGIGPKEVLPKVIVSPACPLLIQAMTAAIHSTKKEGDIAPTEQSFPLESLRSGLIGYRGQQNRPPVEQITADRLNRVLQRNPDASTQSLIMAARKAEADHKRANVTAINFARVRKRA